ncbi:Hint domain-containing protein [Candidatus Halocynthiibacter alkanivorans]|uniref:Hint domain-containing protein n=1 Tax=Candidatus Halocynthiibacter alkanivorans TaxID=2267619 RepID=UPI001F2584F7|nr:Hint domain-containing protein [Candidatus Halocynthiibacter alkanivorans]
MAKAPKTTGTKAKELDIDSKASAMEMADAVFGDGVTVLDASYSGDSAASGIYSGGESTSPGVTPGDSGVILSTGKVSDFTNSKGAANSSGSTSNNTSGVNNDAGFNALAGTSTYDASILDVDFIPEGDTLTMQFVFSSDEYPEYAASLYNDVVGVWINGNYVPMTISGADSSVGNVNDSNNENLYIDNTGGSYNTEMDGFTVTMTLTIPVNAGALNSIRIGIADVSDSSYDSNLLIAGDSLQTTLIANADDVDIAPDGSKTLDVLANDSNATGGSLTVTHINGVAVSAGDSVTLQSGQTVQLNPDGTLTISTDADLEDVSFTYGISSSTGESDTGFVTVNTVPCFVAGTGIHTPDGLTPVEDLRPGDLVLTRDDGARPLRWSGSRTVAAEGDFAPIHFSAGALGDHGALTLSPQHRVLVSDGISEMLFGEAEVLIAAKDLVNDHSIRRQPGGSVTYVHLLFDHHQVIWSEGLATESFLPGPQVLQQFEQDTLGEICALFPELDPSTGQGYSAAARPLLKGYEARLLAYAPAV